MHCVGNVSAVAENWLVCNLLTFEFTFMDGTSHKETR